MSFIPITLEFKVDIDVFAGARFRLWSAAQETFHAEHIPRFVLMLRLPRFRLLLLIGHTASLGDLEVPESRLDGKRDGIIERSTLCAR